MDHVSLHLNLFFLLDAACVVHKMAPGHIFLDMSLLDYLNSWTFFQIQILSFEIMGNIQLNFQQMKM